MANTDSAVNEEQGFLSHLIELRDRLLKMMLAVGLLFLCLFWFADDIYTVLASPLLRHMPDGQMIAIDVAAPFFIPFKLTLMLCIFLAVPYLLYQIWAFVAPGLYSHEKRLVLPLLVSSTVLFYLGVAFAYFVVFPLVFGFFTSVAPEGVEVSTDIGRYLDFVITLFFAFGIAFEVPVATVLVVAVGITTPEQLVKIRPYVFVAAFIIGMFLTPPDMISQTLLAIPMWLLYEVGIVLSRHYKQRIVEAGEARDRLYDEEAADQSVTAADTGSAKSRTASSSAASTVGSRPAASTATGAAASGTAITTASTNAGSATGEATGEAKATSGATDSAGGDNGSAVVDPALIQQPDANGVYRNSLTDHDEQITGESTDKSTGESTDSGQSDSKTGDITDDEDGTK